MTLKKNLIKLGMVSATAAMLGTLAVPSSSAFANENNSNNTTALPQNNVQSGKVLTHKTMDNQELFSKANKYVYLSNKQFHLSSEANAHFNQTELNLINNQINGANQSIASAASKDGNITTNTFNKTITASSDQNTYGLEGMGTMHRKNGVTKVTWHWNYVRVYISRNVLRWYGKYGVGGAGAAAIDTSVMPIETMMKVAAQVSGHALATIPDGIHMDFNYLQLGLTTGGYAGVGLSVAITALTESQWQ